MFFFIIPSLIIPCITIANGVIIDLIFKIYNNLFRTDDLIEKFISFIAALLLCIGIDI